MKNHFERFCDRVESVIGLCASTKELCGDIKFSTELYEVCKDVSYIGLNAGKAHIPNTTKTQGVFQFSDIDAAALHIIELAFKYPQTEISDLLEIIKNLHKYANDGRTRGDVWLSSDVGGNIDYAELPLSIWNKFSAHVEECFANGTSPDSAHSAIFNT